jgi:uncharacterized protein (DUF58 family)
MSQAPVVNEAVQVTVPILVGLNRRGADLPLHSGRILAQQSGDMHSPFKGRGMEFDESRPYQPGDDIRNLDWRVTARTGKPHTKLFREERERPVFLWIDLRPSMFFATRGRFKSVVAARMAGLLAWSAVRHGDRIGGIVFSENVHHEVRPQRGRAGALRLIRQVVQHPAWQAGPQAAHDPGSCARALARLRRIARPGSLVFLLSDFRGLDEHAGSHIVRISRHCEVVMICIHDPLERELPPPGFYRVSDGRRNLVLDTFDAGRVDRYRQRFEERLEALESLARANRILFMTGSTGDDPLAVLRSGLAARPRR